MKIKLRIKSSVLEVCKTMLELEMEVISMEGEGKVSSELVP